MSTDTLAARLRAAYHADMPGEAVPFDELKPCVCDRWQRVADVAAQEAHYNDVGTAEYVNELQTRIAELESTIRVPFTDAQIERMARAAQETMWRCAATWPDCIRAALAAVGLEPCAPPEHDPADVAMRPTDDKPFGGWHFEDGYKIVPNGELLENIEELSRDTPIIADLHKQLEAARREVDEVRRHISVTMSREHQARKEAQEAKRELSHLHPGETVDGVIVERDHYRIRLERAEQDAATLRAELAELRDQIDDDNTNAAAVNDLLIKLQNLTAERDALRERAGWELDVTAEEALCKWLDFVQDNTMINTIREYNDWLRSSIRTTYECKECAGIKNAALAFVENTESIARSARAALEGE